jgi:hypothetical protein
MGMAESVKTVSGQPPVPVRDRGDSQCRHILPAPPPAGTPAGERERPPDGGSAGEGNGGESMRWFTSLLAAAGSFVLAGCGHARTPTPEARVGVSNPAYAVDRLFTDERGNGVYRFRDRGEYHYYVVGPGGAQMVPPPTRPSVADPAVEAN